MGEDRFEMSQRERDRLKVLHEVRKGKLTQVEAGRQLKLSTRQVRRLIGKMDKLGDRAVALPFHTHLTADHVAFIVGTMKDSSVNVGAGAAIYL